MKQIFERLNKKTLAIKALKTVFILVLTTLLALVLDAVGIRVENILMLYAVAILIIITETRAFIWGAVSAVVSVLGFNFFFTEPRFSFRVNDPNYFVSFGIFLVVAVIVGTLTTRLNHQVLISTQNEERTRQLYKISSGYLNITGTTNVISYGEKSLSRLIAKPCKLYIKTQSYNFTDEAVQWCYTNSLACGFGETHLEKSRFKYLPIRGGHKTLGVVAIDVLGTELTKEELLYTSTMLSQITIALEHDFLTSAEETNRLNVEKEKLKNNLLRSISHDLRTPLTAIAGNAEFLAGDIDALDRDTVKEMLSDIGTDASWLSNMVENLLNMTRIQDGRLLLNTRKEVVDDIIAESLTHVAKRLGAHTIKVIKPETVELVPMDGRLMIQVLVNLIDNCIKHTQEGSEIVISARKDKAMIFEVSDNGGGIKPDLLDVIFDSFVSTSATSGDTHRGVGLGLSIVKSIIEAHGGVITAENNKNGGATFRFTLPLEGATPAEVLP